MGLTLHAVTAETVGQKSNTKNLVQLKVAEQLSRNDSLFRAQAMLSHAGRHSWEPVCICKNTTQTAVLTKRPVM